MGCWLFAACTPASSGDTRTTPAPREPEAPLPSVVDTLAAVEAPPDAAPLQIGWSVIPPKPTRRAAALNEKALGLHAKGDYEGSLVGFEAADEASPGYAWAGFNRACALSRLGRTEDAARALEPLLLEDFPQFRPRLLEDEDLEALRRSSDGTVLAALLPRLSTAYAEALQRGIPAFLYEERSGWTHDDHSGAARTPYTRLRVGVYDPTTRRFVPMTPRLERAYSGLLLRDPKRAIVAAGQLARKDMWWVQPHAASAVVYSLEDWGDVLLEAKDVSPSDDVFHGFELWLGPDDALYGAQYMVGYGPQTDFLRWSAKGREKIGWTHEDTAHDDPPTDMPHGGQSLTIYERARPSYPGGTTSAFFKGHAVGLDGVEGTVELDPDQHGGATIYGSPDPMIFVVMSNQDEFGDDGGEELRPEMLERHVIELVDMHDETVTRLSKGPGYAHVVWASDGSLFVDTPTGVRRYAPGSTSPIEDVPPGVRFGTPPFPQEGGV